MKTAPFRQASPFHSPSLRHCALCRRFFTAVRFFLAILVQKLTMASIKVKFRPSSVDGHEGTIYYQIIHERKVRQVVTLYHVFPAEWDAHRSMVKANMQQSNERRTMVLLIRERIGRDVERLTKIDRKLNACGLPYMADDVVDEFNRYSREYSLFNYKAPWAASEISVMATTLCSTASPRKSWTPTRRGCVTGA